MTSLLATTPDLIRTQAELQDLRWVAQQMVSSHDRAAQRLAKATPVVGLPWLCHCSLCRHARPWVKP